MGSQQVPQEPEIDREAPALATKTTRRGVLKWLGAGVAVVLAGGEGGRRLLGSPASPNASRAASGPRQTLAADTTPLLGARDGATISGGVQRFRSCPDVLAPEVVIDHRSRGPLGGLVITDVHGGPSQSGPLIVDQTGRIIWFQPLSAAPSAAHRAFNVQVQHYRGRPVLTWWQGAVVAGHGQGSYVLMDTSYRFLAEVRAARGRQGDLHEFVVTSAGTALFTCYGLAEGYVREHGVRRKVKYWVGYVQEVDIESGKLLFEWRSDRHIALSESYVPSSALLGGAWDYMHVNAISVDPSDHNLIISGRNTCAVYKVSRKTGRVIWRLGGRRSDFRIGSGTHFAFQHDVKLHPGGRLTLFDNEGGPPRELSHSRALVLAVDMRHRRVRRVESFSHHPQVYSDALGSVQPLAHDRYFVGWGRATYFTEYGSSGAVRFEGHLTPGASSYRDYRQSWSALPQGAPLLAVVRSGSTAKLYASFNGATALAGWEVLGGTEAGSLGVIGTASVAGFETEITVPNAPAWLAVAARDDSGRVLGRSQATTG
jgi:hypothetical protein